MTRAVWLTPSAFHYILNFERQFQDTVIRTSSATPRADPLPARIGTAICSRC
jgi:hypothetical protein